MRSMQRISQKAAWFTGSRYFENLVQGAGLQGFDGIRRTAELMEEAFLEEKYACNKEISDDMNMIYGMN